MSNNIKLAEVIIRTWSDEKFKNKFISNPQLVFEEFGLTINKNSSKIKVVENTNKVTYFVLPSKPESLKFDEADLKAYVEELVAVQLVLPTILV